MSIVNYSEDKTLTIDYKLNDDENEKWHIKLDICTNPTCGCRDVTFELYGSENKESAIPKHRMTIDVFKNKAVKLKGNKPTSKEDFQLAKALAKKLSEKDWRHLRKFFLDVKRHITKSASIKDLNITFPEKKIEKDGLMIGYHNIFPYAEDIVIELDDIHYVLDDQYCLSYTCPCTHTGLSFLARKKDLALNQYNPLFIIFDYKTNTYEIENRGTKKIASPKVLVKEIQRKQLGEVFKERHEKLRTLYDNYREAIHGPLKQSRIRQEITRTSDGAPKIGRNDPCPCGSGKKYKKCCMK